MSNLWSDSCAAYGADAEATTIGGYAAAPIVTFALTGGRFGTGAFAVTNGDGLELSLACGVEASVGFVARITNAPASGQVLLRCMEGSTVHVDLRLNASKHLIATRNGTALAGAEGTTVIAQNIDYVIQFRTKLHDSTGTVELWVDDVQQFALGTLDTRNAGTPLLNYFAWAGSGATINMQVSEIYVNDTAGAVNNGIAGSYRIYCRRPTGAGNYADWTPSASTNVSNVDDAQGNDGDGTYNSDSTAGHRDSFQFGAVPWTSGTIASICHRLVARKDDAGVRSIAPMQRQSGADQDGTTQVVTTAYAGYRQILETNPSTSAAYTTAEMRATSPEFGYKEVA